MKELKTHEDWSWNAWFWVDKEEFDGEWRIGQCRYHVEKAVGRDTDGRLFLMVWTNHDKYNSSNFSQIFYEIDLDEYFSLLERAVAQGEVKPNDRDYYADMPKSPFTPPWDIKKDVVVYHDEKYTLGQKNKEPYLVANGKKFKLSCHPYEPCLYITDESGFMSVIHNAFDPFDVLKAFFYGECISSITGFEYDAKDFCRMVEYAADKVDIGIDYAEKVFGDRPKKKATEGEAKTFYDLIAEYPDCVIDYCIVKGEAAYRECESHWLALCLACHRLFKADESGQGWRYDACKARARKISTEEFFESEDEGERLSYRKAFFEPPHGTDYIDDDFEKINNALFPNGTDALEVYKWTTDWSDYFDDGHEWWGALCCTVYDKSLNRFVVIMASETD